MSFIDSLLKQRDRLSNPAVRGVPMCLIGTNGKAPEDENKLAYFRPQGLPIELLSDLRIDSITIFSSPVDPVNPV